MDSFLKNVIMVFLGTSLVNFLNLLYQLLIAHNLSVVEFASFNVLLSIYTLISSPLGTLQAATAKYSAEFKARNELTKVKALLSGIFKRSFSFALATFFAFSLLSIFLMRALKIPDAGLGYILAGMLALAWLAPVFMGALQGLELFHWLLASSLAGGILKLVLACLFIWLGYNVAGGLGAFVVSIFIGLFIAYLPLKDYLSLKNIKEDIDYKEIFFYLFPVGISYFCFMALVNFDMVLVKYFFSPQESGLYAIAQMVGKILLFLPGAISIVMFPRTSGLNAASLETYPTLKRSLLYSGTLCLVAGLFYNSFPSLLLKALTGKSHSESIILGRLFSVSMSGFTLLFIIITYFLSLKDLRFLKYLVLFTLLQTLAIVFFHKSLLQVQLILCANAVVLLVIHLMLLFKKQGQQ